MGAALAAVHDIETLRLKAAALHQGAHALCQCCIVQYLEFVEQGRNPGRINQHGQQVKAHPNAPGPGPPEGARRSH